MKNLLYLTILLAGILPACHKSGKEFSGDASSLQPDFKTYTIKAGEHYSDQNVYAEIETHVLKFSVRFDSSAIYSSLLPENQYDINKLYGFSDNASHHHEYSARMGWGWSENELRLYAYVYNAGTVLSKEITTVVPGSEVSCSIEADSSHYIFRVNHITEALPRSATTVKGKGYRLYPYFGGDEPAPHNITIKIREEL